MDSPPSNSHDDSPQDIGATSGQLHELADRIGGHLKRDRRAVIEILEAAVAVGARIRVSGSPWVEGELLAPGPGTPADSGAGLPGEWGGGGELGRLLAAWGDLRERDRRAGDLAEAYARLSRRLLSLGEALLGYDVVCDGLTRFPEDRTLRQIQGLALARTGAVAAANQVLDTLLGEGHRDVETLGLLARTEKDLGLQPAADLDAQLVHLGRSRALYEEAYRSHGGVWSGINTASVSALLAARFGEEDRRRGLAEESRRVASEIEARCLAEMGADGGDRFWTVATLGESCLLQGQLDRAARWYEEASRIARGSNRFGDLGTTRRQALTLAREMGLPPDRIASIRSALRIPGVAILVGHMIDRPRRVSERFPSRQVGAVREAILRRLVKDDIKIGYASAACGADLLFLDALLELGGEAHVVVPYPVERFIEDSVDLVPGGEWVRLFRSILERSEVLVASKQRLAVGGVSYDYTNLILHGLSVLHSDQLGAELHHMTVWDGRPGDGPGGTASTIARWQAGGWPIVQFEPHSPGEDGRRIEPPPRPAGASRLPLQALPSVTTETAQAKVVGILFGDVKGFSGLLEDQIPPFVEHFLGLVARCLADLPQPPIKKNTWGDGIYLVFDDIRTTGVVALDLCRRVEQTDWAAFGLPAGMTLRIGLHAGPVYLCIDPVTESPNCMGTHVSHGARIEPATPPGQVYASREFAALAAADGIGEFRCQYVGQTPWAKGYGIYPTYHIREA